MINDTDIQKHDEMKSELFLKLYKDFKRVRFYYLGWLRMKDLIYSLKKENR